VAYKAAGADGGFVPGLTDIALITKLCHETQLPLNVLGGTWIPSFEVLKSAGVARISIGSGIFRAAATCTQHAYRHFIQDDFSFLKDSLSYEFINNLYK
jgi:2-methylisocitrate lyase-like PEP mutase family enzyme